MRKAGLIGILLGLNVLSAWFYWRLDLTSDKKYSLSDGSKVVLAGLKETAFVEVYLDGSDLPGGFQRLKVATQELLEDYKAEAGSDRINYSFIEPANLDAGFIDTLVNWGVQPTNIFDSKGGQRTETLVFPYARIIYQDKQQIVPLLKANKALSAQEKLNQSAENLEYSFSKAFQKLLAVERPKVGLLAEFTSLKPVNFAAVITSLQEYCDLYILQSENTPGFEGLDALILPKPDFPIDPDTKFKIDQYVMSGGNVLFFVDGLKIDSIGLEGTYAQPLEVQLDDLLFKYGIRINKDIIKDGVSCAAVPMVVGSEGEQANIQAVPYRYFPLINNFGTSLITKNLDLVYTRFVSSLDTLPVKGVKKTILLSTTPFTKVLQAPALVTYNDGKKETDKEEFNQGVKHVAVLLEGSFSSLYANKLLPDDPRAATFKSKGNPAKILVCSDGDLLVNDVDSRTGDPLPLGLDKMSGAEYGNLDFFLNSMAYMLEGENLIAAKEKDIILRPLDPVKVREERQSIQIKAILVPILIITALGLGFNWYRRKIYT